MCEDTNCLCGAFEDECGCEGFYHEVPRLGEPAPDFVAETTHGQIKLSDYKDKKWVVLFSHPADFTPVCTTEFVAFSKEYSECEKRNVALIGLSVDSSSSHLAWARDIAGMAFRKKAGEFKKSNVEYVQKCIASFLYGSAVVSDSDRYSFFGASALPDSSGLRFFNRFASSLVGNTDNLVLTCFTDTTVSGPYDIRDRFLRSWDGEDGGGNREQPAARYRSICS